MVKRDSLFKVVENTRSEEFPIAIILTPEFAEGLGKQLIARGAINGAFNALSHRLVELSSRVMTELDADELSYEDVPVEE